MNFPQLAAGRFIKYSKATYYKTVVSFTDIDLV